MKDRQGCLAGLGEFLLLGWLFDWLQDNFGFGRGISCTGCGCGMILLILFIIIACRILTGTDWFRLFYVPIGWIV